MYLTEPAAGRPPRARPGGRRHLPRPNWKRGKPASRQAAAASAQAPDSTPAKSPVFFRMVRLPRQTAEGAVTAWRNSARAGGVVAVPRLRLESPEGDAAGGWTIHGRMRRWTWWHWTPVSIEMWPVYEDFVVVTMTPKARVFPSRRYFRLGNSALDNLGLRMGVDASRSRPRRGGRRALRAP